MGLDQWACAITEVDEDGEILNTIEIARWRKHPNLQGWMEKRWREKNPSVDPLDDFNCERVFLNMMDLRDLEKAVKEDDLPETSGFFFGYSTKEDRVADLEFVEKAKAHIRAGMKVFYSSWW